MKHTFTLLTALLLASLAGAAPLQLDGLSGWIADNDKRLDLTEAVTLETWVRPNAVDKGGSRIVEKAGAYSLDTAPGMALPMSVAAGAISSRGQLPTNRLSHIVGVFSRADGVFKLYVDGKEVASQGREAMRKLSVTPSPLKVGADRDGRSFTPFGGRYALEWANNRGDRIGLFCYNNDIDSGQADFTAFRYDINRAKGATPK